MTLNKSTSALLILFAIGAFLIGVAVKLSPSHEDIDSSTLLSAELLDIHGQTQGVSQHLDAVTIINFWASWCAPCREEMPLLQHNYEQHQQSGLNIVGIAIDDPLAAQPMLDSMGISYPILFAESTGMELMALVGNPQGLLPYTVILNEHGDVIEAKFGLIREHHIAEWTSMLQKTAQN